MGIFIIRNKDDKRTEPRSISKGFERIQTITELRKAIIEGKFDFCLNTNGSEEKKEKERKRILTIIDEIVFNKDFSLFEELPESLKELTKRISQQRINGL